MRLPITFRRINYLFVFQSSFFLHREKNNENEKKNTQLIHAIFERIDVYSQIDNNHNYG